MNLHRSAFARQTMRNLELLLERVPIFMLSEVK